MRSRYTGYVAGDTGHILATTHPDSPHHQADAASWAAQVASFCQGTTFEGLQVEHTHQEGDRGWVRFEARIRQNGRASSLREHSEFHRVDGQWLYLEGTDPSTP
jgi:SEC-C motif-containing protein